MELIAKKQLSLFFVIAFGMPVLLGVLLGITYYRGGNTDIFPNTWMFLPACAVMVGKLYFEKENCPARPFTEPIFFLPLSWSFFACFRRSGTI